MMSQKTRITRTLPWLAGLLAWIIPGAGHVYIGRTVRGIIIFVTVAATFWTGIAIGGVMTVDKENERWWFIGEMCTGVHGLVSWQRQTRQLNRLDIPPPAAPGSAKALQRQIEIDAQLAPDGLASVYPQDVVAHAYAGIAGLLNLMCIFDAVILSLIGIHGESDLSAGGKKREGGQEK